MHSIEPFFQWRDYYRAEDDENSPFYLKEYNEFSFQNSIYNYLIHPQWDYIGSPTLYIKILYSNYDIGFCIIELIGEWNDTLHNDIMFLKRDIADHLMDRGIKYFILICDNVLNFHASDNLYLEEWATDLNEKHGWICCINLLDHVFDDFEENNVQNYIYFEDSFNDINWRLMKAEKVFAHLSSAIYHLPKKIIY